MISILLHYRGAAFEGHVEFARMLLKGGITIDAPDGNGKSPLHWAVHMDRTQTVRLLLEHGADVDAWDVSGETPS